MKNNTITMNGDSMEHSIMFFGKNNEEIFKVDNSGIYVYGEKISEDIEGHKLVVEGLQKFLKERGFIGG